MKKQHLKTLAALLALLLLAGCGRSAVPEATIEPTVEPEPEAEVALPNPLRESSEAEILERFGLDMKAPEGAREIAYTVIEGEKPLAQLDFTRDGAAFCWRAAHIGAYEDISGLYEDWQTVSFTDGEQGSLRLSAAGAGVIDCFDADSGLVLCLSMREGASAELLESISRRLWGPTAEQELVDCLTLAHGRYFPGTAGSSLSAAACAAQLADLFAESGMSADEVFDAVQRYTDALAPEETQLFELQLDGIVAAFSYLRGENGEGILSDCGCESTHYPWNEPNVQDCFVALLGSD